MFLFSPAPPPVLSLDSKKDHYFPVRRFRHFEAKWENETSFVPESLFTLKPKEVFELPLRIDERLFFFLGAAFAVDKESPFGWVTGAMRSSSDRFNAKEIYVTPLRDAKKTINPVDAVAWLMAQNAVSFSESVLTKMGNLNETMGFFLANRLISPGDILTVGVEIVVDEPGEYRFGVNGVGAFNLRFRS